MCASVSLSGAIIDWILVTSLLSREVGARKEEEEEQEEQEGEEENETRLGGRPLLGRRLEKKRKRVASLHRCRFRALPLGATFAPGTAYANGKPGASRRRVFDFGRPVPAPRTRSLRREMPVRLYGDNRRYIAVPCNEIHMRKMSTKTTAAREVGAACSRS